jgi:Tol biopolymer transport system component
MLGLERDSGMERVLGLGSMQRRIGALVLAGLLVGLSLTILGSAGTPSAILADTASPEARSPGSGGADQPIDAEIGSADWQEPVAGSGVITLTLAHEANRLEALVANGEISSTSAGPTTPSDATLDGVSENLPMSPADLAAVRQRLAYDSRANPAAEAALLVNTSPDCAAVDSYCVYLPVIRRPLPDHFEIYAIDADGTGLVNVSQSGGGDVDPVYSPDGSRIAWVHYSGSNGEIYVANADGSNRINLSNHSMLETSPTWSADGSQIAYTRYVGTDHPEIFVRNSDGSGTPTQLTNNASPPYCKGHSPEWSPNGARIAYVCGLGIYSEVYVMNGNGSNKTRLTDDDAEGHREDGALDWNPDSIRLAYTKWNATRKKSDIYVVNVDTKAITNLTNDTARTNSSPAWSPDGSKIAFHAYLDGQNFEIATMNANGSNLTNLTQRGPGDGNYWPRWSADGAKISFLSSRDGNLELYIMDSNGTSQTRMTYTAYDENEHDWEPQVPTE